MVETSPASLEPAHVRPLADFLRPRADADRLAQEDPNFAAFLAQALNDSGESARNIAVDEALYRLVEPDGAVHFDLGYRDVVPVNGQNREVAEFIRAYLDYDLVQITHGLWRLTSWDELREYLFALGGIVRFERSLDDSAAGHIIPAETTMVAVNAIQQGIYMLDNAELVTDSITRTLGLRRKVVMMNRSQRSSGGSGGGDESLTAKLGRTLFGFKR